MSLTTNDYIFGSLSFLTILTCFIVGAVIASKYIQYKQKTLLFIGLAICGILFIGLAICGNYFIRMRSYFIYRISNMWKLLH